MPLISIFKRIWHYLLRKAFFLSHRKIKFSLIEAGLILNSGGVLHIGAHKGQERYLYKKLGAKVVWIEALPEIFTLLKENLTGFENQVATNALLGSENRDNVNFYETSNDSLSASIFKINPIWGLPIVKTTRLKMTRLDLLYSAKDLANYKHWVIDVQGSELEVLLGAGELLNNCNSLRIEVSTFNAYYGGVQFNDLMLYLNGRGFEALTDSPPGAHGDVIFIRNLQ